MIHRKNGRIFFDWRDGWNIMDVISDAEMVLMSIFLAAEAILRNT